MKATNKESYLFKTAAPLIQTTNTEGGDSKMVLATFSIAIVALLLGMLIIGLSFAAAR